MSRAYSSDTSQLAHLVVSAHRVLSSPRSSSQDCVTGPDTGTIRARKVWAVSLQVGQYGFSLSTFQPRGVRAVPRFDAGMARSARHTTQTIFCTHGHVDSRWRPLQWVSGI